MEKINLYEALLMEQKEKNDFYRERIYDDLSGFIYSTISRDTDKRAFLLRLENLIKKIDKTYKKLVPKYKEYIKAFALKKVIPLENVKYEDFKIVQNLNDFDLLDYADFIKLGGNIPKRLLFNLNKMNPKQIELTMYIRFINSLLYHVKINFIHDIKSDGFDLFVVLNDDVDGMLLVVTTNWYLKFFDEDEFKAKWKAYKKLRVSDYQNANCLSLDKNKVFEKQEFEKSRDYEFPQIPKDMLFIFENDKDKTIIFEKKWMRLYNSMFWSSPQKFELPIKNIVAIALKNNPSFQAFLDLYLLFGKSLILYVFDIFDNEEIENIKKYTEFYERCFDIFGVSFKNRKKIVLKKIPIVEQDFSKIIYSKLFNVNFEEAVSSCPLGKLYLKSVKENKKLIKKEIEEYIADCFLADLKSLCDE